MNKETRTLYVVIITFIFIFAIFDTYKSYKFGIAKGKLLKMEEFRDSFMPKPENVFPNAVVGE